MCLLNIPIVPKPLFIILFTGLCFLITFDMDFYTGLPKYYIITYFPPVEFEMPKDWMNNFVRVNGTGKADYGEYKPSETTRSGRNTQRPQWYDILIQCTYHNRVLVSHGTTGSYLKGHFSSSNTKILTRTLHDCLKCCFYSASCQCTVKTKLYFIQLFDSSFSI